MGGTMSSSQAGVGVGQMGGQHQRGVEGAGQRCGGRFSWQVGVGPGQMVAAGWFGGATRPAQGVVSGQMGGQQQCGVDGTRRLGQMAGNEGGVVSLEQQRVGIVVGTGWLGGASRSSMGLGHMDVEGARQLCGATNSSQRVLEVGQIGGTSLGVLGGQHQMVSEQMGGGQQQWNV